MPIMIAITGINKYQVHGDGAIDRGKGVGVIEVREDLYMYVYMYECVLIY